MVIFPTLGFYLTLSKHSNTELHPRNSELRFYLEISFETDLNINYSQNYFASNEVSLGSFFDFGRATARRNED